ncbi:hypothetical protein MVEN_00910400 [Mycena venus]|uniref:Uncharacterized protein n=1 Tax=Mycena venus TaxID=2733690 RepID=A0A8H6YCA0_9AGAR|nr:hypothetical protein MVEN_00910400 [Mycena venus]
MSSCVHALNSDISGIGVRISYYMQTLFLGCLSVRSGSLDEIAGALYTLMATNTAMAVTGLILGLKPKPEISFQDAVIMLYLLSMGWITVVTALASCNRLSDDTNILQLVSVIQSYVIISFAFAVVAKAASFGENADCNQEAVAVIFRPFSALRHGRIFGWCIIGFIFATYTMITFRDYTARIREMVRGRRVSHNESASPPSVGQGPILGQYFKHSASPVPGVGPLAPKRQSTYYGIPTALVDNQLLVIIFFILVIWAFLVLNTELTIRWYRPTQNDAVTNWQFGQMLPMFLTLLPLINMISAFNKFGIKPTKRVLREVEVSVINDNEFESRQK